MKHAEGWNQVIRFDSIKPIDYKGLPPEQQAEHIVCTFVNEFIDIFNTQPLSTRLACVGKLAAMVGFLSMAAMAANIKKLPYVEPNCFQVDRKGQRLPLIHFAEEKPAPPPPFNL